MPISSHCDSHFAVRLRLQSPLKSHSSRRTRKSILSGRTAANKRVNKPIATQRRLHTHSRSFGHSFLPPPHACKTAPRKSRSDDELLLIEAVKKFPILWQKNLKSYNDNVKKGLAWIEVGKACGMESKAAMKAWKLIRCAFSDKVRKLPTGSGAEDRVDYVYADEMQFVVPYLDDRPERTSSLAIDSQKDPFLPTQPVINNNDSTGTTTGNDSDSETSEQTRCSVHTQSVASFAMPKPPKQAKAGTSAKASKRRIDDAFQELVEVVKQPPTEEDNDDAGLFGKSVAHFLRRLEPHMLRPAKMSIESVMYHIESGRPMRLQSFVPVEDDDEEQPMDGAGTSGGASEPGTVGEDITHT